MSSILYRLEYQSNLTHAEQECARYILSNAHLVTGKSITELAHLSGYSTATISRLCKKVSKSGFEIFQKQLSDEISNSTIDGNFPFKKNDTQNDVKYKLQQLYQGTLNQTIKVVDDDMIKTITQMFEGVSSFSVYAAPKHMTNAYELQIKMKDLDRYVNIITEKLYMSAAKSSSPDQLALILASEDYPDLIKAASVLHERGARVILIASASATNLIDMCPYHITLAPLEKPGAKIANFSTQLSMAFILDYIVSCLFMRHYDQNMTKFLNNESSN